MQIQIKNKRLAVDYCGVGWLGLLKFQVIDDRPLSEIAPDVEGAETIEVYDNGQKTETYEGFTQMTRIERIDYNHRVVVLQKPEAQNGNV